MIADEWLDEYGYPTAEVLTSISEWNCLDIKGVLEFVRELWHWRHLVTNELTPGERKLAESRLFPDKCYFRFVTGGWLGNEMLICALEKNQMIWAISWRLSVRGGLHIFGY